MNIFVLDWSPQQAAEYHCDSHVVKMPTESIQMLTSVMYSHCGDIAISKSGKPYRDQYRNHPCTLWAGSTNSNYIWLCKLAKALCTEYQFRYRRNHYCELALDTYLSQSDLLTPGPLETFPQAMPSQYQQQDTVLAYRAYYKAEKYRIAKYTRRQPPEFMEQ